MDPIISSKQNRLVKLARKISSGIEKERRDLFVIEGVRLMEEALAEKIEIEHILVSPKLESTGRGRALLARIEALAFPLLRTRDEILASVSGVKTPQGIIALAKKPAWNLSNLLPARTAALLLVACQVRDPGNLGALLRAANAAGATGALLCSGCADPYNPKAVRAAMGALFRLPLLTLGFAPIKDFLRENKIQLVAAHQQAQLKYTDIGFKRPTALAIGGEAEGLPKEVLAAADTTARIPMSPAVESLNAAIAGAIFLYEAARQRGFA